MNGRKCRTMPEILSSAEEELERRIGGGPAVDALRERIIRLEEQCDLPGLAENKRRERGRWMLAAAFLTWLAAALLPLAGAWLWLKIEPLLGSSGATVQPAAALSLCALIAILLQLGYVTFGYATGFLTREVRRGNG